MTTESFDEFRARRERERETSWHLIWRRVTKDTGGGLCAQGPNGETFRIYEAAPDHFLYGYREGTTDRWIGGAATLAGAKRGAAAIASRQLDRSVT